MDSMSTFDNTFFSSLNHINFFENSSCDGFSLSSSDLSFEDIDSFEALPCGSKRKREESNEAFGDWVS